MPNTFETYQEMLEEFWNVSVTNDAEVQFVRALTERLMETESIWTTVNSVKGDRRVISSLCNKGILEQQRKQIRFSHQTIQEFAIARLFEETGSSLSDFIRKHEGAIFCRRTVSAVLRHLRENDRDKYHREVNAIVSRQTRLHIMFLLIDFMCRQQNPTPHEIEHVKGFLHDDERRLRVLIGINNRKNWFAALKGDSLPEIMERPEVEQWPLISVLANSWSFDWEGTFTLVSENWSQDQKFDNLTLRVMKHCENWNQEALQLVELVVLRVTKTQAYNYQIEELVGVISAASPNDGARIAAKIIATDAPQPDPPTRWNRPLEQTKGWYDLEAIAMAAPMAFFKELAPWLRATVETHHSGYSGSVLAHYAGDCTALDNREHPRESPILTAIQSSIDLISKSEPREFIQISRPFWESENAVLHRLYIQGLMNVVTECPDDVFEYLMGDNRRFSVSQHGDTKDSQSAELIGLLFPHLNSGKRGELIERIVAWTKYRDGVELIDDQLVWDRESRLHLLTAIPAQYLSESLTEFIEGEKSKLPEWDQEIQRSHSGWVKTLPPMTQDEMATANDDELIEAFSKEKPDRSAWNPVEGGFEEQGGGEASAEQLAKLAESDYERAGMILRLLVEKGVTANIHQALEGLGKCSDRKFVFTLLKDISPQCDESESFRESASRTLLHLCDDNGLPEEEIQLLERWLNMPWDHTRSVVIDGDQKEWKPEISFLWTNSGSMIIDTDQSYYTLTALTHGLLGRDEPQGDRWISDLSTHLDRDVSLKTWRMFCDRLRYVRGNGCSPELGKALIAKLFNKFPRLPSDTLGCRLLAQLVRFLDADVLRDIFQRLRASSDPFDQQAVRELLTLSSLLDETSGWASSLFTQELDQASEEQNSAFLVGCAHAVSNLWHDLEKPSECARTMRKIFSTGDAQAINVTRQLFWNDVGLPGNKDTAGLIVALTENIDAVDAGLAEDLLSQMTDILPDDLRLEILDFCKRLVGFRFDELKRREFGAYEAGPYLVEIAMTLQRFPDTRTSALDLFEQLLRAGLDDADKALKDVDGIEESNPLIRTPRRRRRQQGRRNKA